MSSIAHYCQKCLAANPLGQELCARCGTRLMLVVDSPAARYDTQNWTASYEEHLLERVSALENRLTRLTDKLEQGLELLLRQAKNSYFDHALLETLIDVLTEAGTIEAGKLEELWRERCRTDQSAQDERERREQLSEEIIAGYRGPDQAVFEQYVQQAMTLLEGDETTRAVRVLERAAALAPGNAPLLYFIGEHFFSINKMALARDYLARAFDATPDSYAVCLLLGLACGDEGELERARELLVEAARRDKSSFAAHYGLGRLLAAEQRWKDALGEFKLALAAHPSPEAHYVIGCVYYQLGRDRMSVRHLRKAVEMDGEYAAAFYMLGLVFTRTGEGEQAKDAFSAARTLSGNDPRYRTAARRIPGPDDAPELSPLFSAIGQSKKRLVTGGDRRLAKVIRREALNAVRAGSGHYR
ncbi:MAG TPA: tetratricopeptide repeat protein [Pyrinomonadaceae bacterium]|jgi:tetratricopeptide (TPR) repeat protein